MMTKCFKYMMLVGVALSMSVAIGAKAETESSGWNPLETASSAFHQNFGMDAAKAAKVIAGFARGFPVIDITSDPAHAVVATEQEFIRLRTEIEEELKVKIKERLSVTWLPNNSFGASTLTQAAQQGGKSLANNMKNKMGAHGEKWIDAKLSYIGIQSGEANEPVEEGIVGKGIEVPGSEGEIEAEGKKETYELAAVQQANWISDVGDLAGKETYAKRRQYLEQEQAIRMLAQAVVLRGNVQKNILESGPVGTAQSNYNKSDTKKDLDGKTGKVEKTNDYNQSLRQYAYYGLIYDQLLSLEQQIIGLRLQAKGGFYAQSASPISDLTEDEKPKIAGGLYDEAQLDARQDTGTTKNGKFSGK